MQHLLTEEEYKDTQLQTEQLQIICTMVANIVPVQRAPKGIGRVGEPWGCIHTAADREGWFCDGCVARDRCPATDKRWSGHGVSPEEFDRPW